MTILTYPFRKPLPNTPAGHDTGLDLRSLFPRGACFPIIGQVYDWQIGGLGLIRSNLRLSLGDLQMQGNRECWPDRQPDGSWVRVRLMNRHNDEPHMSVVSLVAVAAAFDFTAWVPRTRIHRTAGMNTLRQLLARIEPPLQGLFMSVMLDGMNEWKLLSRPAAANHHGYLAGLFDQSVAAASLAHDGVYDREHDRDLATLAALLFDIGKVCDPLLRDDRMRCAAQLQPHPGTLAVLKKPLTRLAGSHASVADEVAELLSDGSTRSFTPRMAALQNQVRQAVLASFDRHRPDPRADVTRTAKGAQA